MNMDSLNSESLVSRKEKKKLIGVGNRGGSKKNARTSAMEGESSDAFAMDEDSHGVSVLMFDHSIENHFRSMDTISKICGAEGQEEEGFDLSEVERLSSTITFLREWKQFYYKPRTIRFACEIGGSQGKDVVEGVNLPQFSSACVPQLERLSSYTSALETSKDFVLYVGGPVWALDWCPSVHQRSDCQIKCEYLAVAAHPPDSSYHKIGAPLTGRGVVQIWCLLNVNVDKGKKEEELPTLKKKRGRPRKTIAAEDSSSALGSSDNQVVQASVVQLDTFNEKESAPLKNVRGRPRKKKAEESLDDFDALGSDNQVVQALAVQSDTFSQKGSASLKKARGRPRKKKAEESLDDFDALGSDNQVVQALAVQLDTFSEKESAPLKKARGRPRKKKADEPLDDSHRGSQCVVALSAELPEDSSVTGADKNTQELAMLKSHDKDIVLETDTQEGCIRAVRTCKAGLVTPTCKRKMKDKARAKSYNNRVSPLLLTQNEDGESQDAMTSTHEVANSTPLEISTDSFHLPKDVSLPRLVLCLAHNGKVAWDVKWRPCNFGDLECKHRMGYLAVSLGNGSLEVWEVPSPRTIKFSFSSCQKDGIDPRFVKLEPVFKCSKLKCGDRQSIPLTVEWSPSFPHDLILAGCHDGTVALWKFAASGSSQCTDTRPLLCFSADTVPIRALAWAPDESDPESVNAIVTAGHEGLRFWDLRDPHRPLWDLNSVRRIIYSVDWLPDPRCVILSFDDGTLRILSLLRSAYDVPVTGKPFVGTQQQGLDSYFCSSFPIWSVQASRLTGMIAYCSSDGSVLRFQLTSKAVDKDASRNRAPHFLCGSLTEEDMNLTVNTPMPNIPFPMKKSLNEWSDTPRSIRGFLSDMNQAKRGSEPMSDNQTMALCYGDDPSSHIVSGDTSAPKKKTTSNNKTSKKKKPDADVASEEELENSRSRENKKSEANVEVFPSKMVAMHRVRWNMKKGSERWLCYGGAAGIVRCQEISASSVADRSLSKK